jgi:hypothetical protein
MYFKAVTQWAPKLLERCKSKNSDGDALRKALRASVCAWCGDSITDKRSREQCSECWREWHTDCDFSPHPFIAIESDDEDADHSSDQQVSKKRKTKKEIPTILCPICKAEKARAEITNCDG